MPSYDYVCESCKHRFEVFQSMKDDALTDCPECKGRIRRVITGGTGVIFKGSGFYVNDSKAASSSAKINSGKPETKVDAKTDGEKKSETKADGEIKPESKTEGKAEAKPESKTESKAQSAPAAAKTE